MPKLKPVKAQKLRNNEHYDTQSMFDELYQKSSRGEIFSNLMKLVRSDNNINNVLDNIMMDSRVRGNSHARFEAGEKGLANLGNDPYLSLYNTETQKKELFTKVRSGKVRVLFGSTAKCGSGTNVQDRLIALHDIDCPWVRLESRIDNCLAA